MLTGYGAVLTGYGTMFTRCGAMLPQNGSLLTRSALLAHEEQLLARWVRAPRVRGVALRSRGAIARSRNAVLCARGAAPCSMGPTPRATEAAAGADAAQEKSIILPRMRLPWMLPAFGLAIALALQNPSPAWADVAPSNDEFGDCRGTPGDLCHRHGEPGICHEESGGFVLCGTAEDDQQLYELVMAHRRRRFLKNLAIVATPITILALFVAFGVIRHRRAKKRWAAAAAEEKLNENA